jgi:hypothetical protein
MILESLDDLFWPQAGSKPMPFLRRRSIVEARAASVQMSAVPVKPIQDIMRQEVGVDGDAQRISQL